MFVSDCLNVNGKGHLMIGGCDTLGLAEKYGTPLYVMDEATVRHSLSLYRNSILKYYSGNGLGLYASKAFCCKEMCRIAQSEHFGLDVVSGGELYTAMQAGFPAEKIAFHGNNKTPEEIEYGLTCGVGRFIVDNLSELDLLDRTARRLGRQASVLFRVKPGIDAHTHQFIRTGQIDSKFGLALETGEAEQAVKRALELGNIRLVGAGCHIGSQIMEIAPFELAARVMINFMADMRDKYGAKLTELDLGGGFGIKYVPSDDPVGYDRYMSLVSVAAKEVCRERNYPLPFILIEPGRSVVASAGITLYKVGAVKEIPNVRTYVSVDGGMADNPRYALYHAAYDAVIADRATGARDKVVTIAGKCCESGDLIQENIAIQTPHVGDTLAVFATGAYNYSMASNYNRLARPAVVMVKDGKSRVIIRRESFEDLVRNDL